MKVFAIIFFLLPVLAFTSATSSSSTQDCLTDYLSYKDGKALVETNENIDNANDVDLADIQGIFNAIALVEMERNKLLMKDSTDASAQLFSTILSLLGNVGWNVGKTFLKKKYCPKNRNYYDPYMPVYGTMGEKSWPEENHDANLKALNQLKVLFGVLKEVEAKMQDDAADGKHAKAKVWWKKAKQWINNTVGGTVKRFLC